MTTQRRVSLLLHAFHTSPSVKHLDMTMNTPLTLFAKRRLATAKKKKVLMLSGPTGSGKSDLSLQLAKQLSGEIISADSVQVFKRMDIGSNKASLGVRNAVPHHLVDILDHRASFNAGDFYRLAREATEAILSRGRIPIVVGGTGFYLRWFINGEGSAPRSTPESKQKVTAILESDGGWARSIERLREIDPTTAEGIPQNDMYRLCRALEIYELSGKPPSFFRMQPLSLDEQDYDFRCIYIDRPDFLHFKREIDDRCEKMVEEGLLEEVIDLIADGLQPNSTAGKAIGYRQALAYLHHENRDKDQVFVRMLDDFMANSRQYCRRQRTWFKKEPSFLWLSTGPTEAYSSEERKHSPSLVADIVKHFELDYDTYKTSIYPRLSQSQEAFQEELGDNYERRARKYTPVLRRFDDFAKRQACIRRTMAYWRQRLGSSPYTGPK